MRTAALLALASTLVWGAAGTTPKKPNPVPSKKSKTKSSGRRKTAAKRGKTSKTAAKRGKGSRSASASASTWRSRQLAPTPDRYKEIQSALAERGYLKKDPSGVWDADSSEALRRFQQDQSLEATGKLNSLSLIALGLGSKHSVPTPAGAAPHAPAPRNPVSAPPQTPQSPVPDSSGPAPSGPAAPSTPL